MSVRIRVAAQCHDGMEEHTLKYADFLACPPPAVMSGHKPFVKMHGLHNHFVIVDQRRQASAFDLSDVVRICDPHTGVGGEQLVTIEIPGKKGQAAGATAAMRIFNVDGREVDACGNATRCVAYLLLEEHDADEILIETNSNVLHCRRAGDMMVSVVLGPISADWRRIGASSEIDTAHVPIESGPLDDGVALFIGNPHIVFFVDRFDADQLIRYAPAVQEHTLFPDGINVGAAEVLDSRTLRLAVWERPGILTRACGTGACVAAYAAYQRGLVKSRNISVLLPAGELKINLREDDSVVMTGPVAFCCYGFVALGEEKEYRKGTT